LLLRVVGDQLLQVPSLIWEGDLGVVPWLQETLLTGDDEAALAGFEVDHESLEAVGDDQHFLGFSGTAFRGTQIRDRSQ
jgi:hypothetical protein